ncbi:hypothetical protein GCM10025762_00830 [Haloechinothrix salitolerans]
MKPNHKHAVDELSVLYERNEHTTRIGYCALVLFGLALVVGAFTALFSDSSGAATPLFYGALFLAIAWLAVKAITVQINRATSAIVRTMRRTVADAPAENADG